MKQQEISPKESFFKRLGHAIFGRLNWNSPPWAQKIKHRTQENPVKVWGLAVVLMTLCVVSWATYDWYQRQPKPVLINAQISVPQATPIAETLTPLPLVLDFGVQDKDNNFIEQSVAPLSAVGKTITAFNINPAIKGEWLWESDSRLVFTPDVDWPANQEYTITAHADAFAAQAKLASHEFTFKTRPFVAEIKSFRFYQDPVDPTIRQAVATVVFNYPVDPTSFETNTQLALQALKDDQHNLPSAAFKYTVRFDEHKRHAYIHSETIELSDIARFLELTLNTDIHALTNAAHLATPITKTVLIPDQRNFFKVNTTSAQIVRNQQDKPEQVVTLETSLGVQAQELNRHVHIYLLPANYPATASTSEQSNYSWKTPGEVTPAILKLAEILPLNPIPADRDYATLHSYHIKADPARYLFIRIDKGTRSLGNFALDQDYSALVRVPEFPKEIGFIHKGALLALAGEKKLSVTVRGVPAVKFTLARVLPNNVNQLVTQSQGDFNNPYFMNASFNEQNISEIFSEVRNFDTSDMAKQQYTAIDFSQYLQNASNAEGPQGLFLLQATGWDTATNSAMDVKASRMVLITDMGLVVKDNQDGSHEIMVQSITQGTPVPNATVVVLGKNGLPLLSQTTNMNGYAHIPTLVDYVDEREPTAYLVSLGTDVSFMPYANFGRALNLSRFDTGGIYSSSGDAGQVSAYLFTERGMYRPGDTAHLAMIVKQNYAQAQPAGLPLILVVSDPRGTQIVEQQLVLDESGYMTLDIPTRATSLTGQYYANLYIAKDQHAQNLLGSTSFRVNEFEPDRMRIQTHLSSTSPEGWVSPEGLTATVNLWNLYGAPAAHRSVAAKLLLSPQAIEFDAYPDYHFADPLYDPKKPPKVFTDNLTNVTTNAEGQAEFDLNLGRFDKATYRLTLFTEGFEAEGGRSVTTQVTTLVSPSAYFVGYKADGDLNYIKQNTQRKIDFVAINSLVQPVAVNGLSLEIYAQQPVSTLMRNPDGTFQYQTMIHSELVKTLPYDLSDKTNNYELETGTIGNYAVHLVDKDKHDVSQFTYSVVGASQKPLARNAELEVKLNQSEYEPGADIELEITAPYTGAGLITIERDRVYALNWFKTDSTTSIQHIHLPADYKGDGYINVTFVRDWESPDIFMSPLSYNVTPFSVSHEEQTINIDLSAAKLTRPGDPLTINYSADKPGKVIVFAVDEGILQLTRYTTPDPLDYFFQKHALEVLTKQTVDQILPKYLQDRELSAVGGDDGEDLLAHHLNPFKRKTDAPVVYWSGIVDIDSTQRQLTYNVPDYFNGTLRIMAVAVGQDSLGSTDQQTIVRGDFVISPNNPTFVAPGDTFDTSVSVANNVVGSGLNGSVTVQVSASPALELVSPASQMLTIAEGQEQTLHFKWKANKDLGSAEMTFVASMGAKSSAIRSTMSVRPSTPFSTTVNSAQATGKQTIALDRSLYPEYRKVEAAVSANPLILVAGLQQYLTNYPYGCTEQLTSRAWPILAMNGQPWFKSDTLSIDNVTEELINVLSQRQLSSGGFAYWPNAGSTSSNDFASVYALHFLTDAHAQGVNVPRELLYNGLVYLKDLAAQDASSHDAARLQAYAIYILTRNEIVTTNYLIHLQAYLEKQQGWNWQEDITGAYIASSWQLLHRDKEANLLINRFKVLSSAAILSDFYTVNTANAQYLYLLAQHFPDLLQSKGDKLVMQIVQALNSDEISTLLSGYSSAALAGYGKARNSADQYALSFTTTNSDKSSNTQQAVQNSLIIPVSAQTQSLTVANALSGTYYYQLTQAGFDDKPMTKEASNGLEVFREYRDAQGNIISEAHLGQEIEVHIRVRALSNRYISNVAVVDLLPGGFDVIRDSVSMEQIDYADVREDRVVFFTGVGSDSFTMVYRIKAVNQGAYQVPAILAESMYHPSLNARSSAGTITVVAP